jgi:D-aminopeptidase
MSGHSKNRGRDLGIPFSGTPGPLNAITDIAGVEVGHTTLCSGAGKLEAGRGPVRTGVTAILPRGREDARLSFAGSFALNGAGEMTGLAWLEERGFLEGPILITNTHSVGAVRDAAIHWMRMKGRPFLWTTPVVGETYDGYLNDIDGGHVKPNHVVAALDGARTGSVEEGSVGGGTGMMCYEYKGGIGTASRVLSPQDGGYTVGALVQANYGQRHSLRIAGLRLGESFKDEMPYFADPALLSSEDLLRYPTGWRPVSAASSHEELKDGSIIVIVATDAPLLPHQLKRLAKRPALAIGRLGGLAAAGSGDLFLAFSTANADVADSARAEGAPYDVKMHPNAALTSLFEAVIDATEEAIVNAMVAAEPCEGANRLRVGSLPHNRVRAALESHRLLMR